MRSGSLLILVVLGVLCGTTTAADFARDIRPILTEHCLACHGPDSGQRQADLRLDELQNAFLERGESDPAIVPGRSSQSPLYQRVVAADPALRMPPVDSGHSLSDQQIELLRKWIDEGAPWPKHWSFQPVARPSVPQSAGDNWTRNPIDAFTLQSMRDHSLQPSNEASPQTLIRRVTLDLTGLPPTPAEISSFVADQSPDAYDRLVDRLMASPRYGERMAVPWLDLARYADTHGYHSDSHRDMWLWRAWVIDALNRNMPFDQFTIEQLAGDLLPGATAMQRLATGFHRNTMINAEDGVFPEEYLVEYAADRVQTTSAVWLGQTLQCARCHDHKYEPYSQRDYYRLFAYFNNVSEKGVDGRKGNAAPLISMPSPSQSYELRDIDERIANIKAQMADRRGKAFAEREQWESELRKERGAAPPADAICQQGFDSANDQLTIEGTPQWLTAGKFQGAVLLNGSTSLRLNNVAAVGENGFSVSLWVFPTTKDRMRMISCGQVQGSIGRWQLLMHEGRLIAQVLFDDSDTPQLVSSAKPLAQRRWQHVLLVCQPQPSSDCVQLYVAGKPVERGDAAQPQTLMEVSAQPLTVGAIAESGFRGLVDELRVYARPLDATEAGLLAGMDPIGELLRVPVQDRTTAQQDRLVDFYLENIDPEFQPLQSSRDDLQRLRRQVEAAIPTTMVMDQKLPSRETFILERGDYRSPGEPVTPGTPQVLPSLSTDAPPTRLSLAKWIVDRNNPLTARVVVNRLWQLHFGNAVVRTPDDFGLRGELPSHPELLDWMAAELMDSGWDVKKIQRLIVTSATYRQTSACDEQKIAADPENKFWARGVRQRLPAEMIRDSALAASGLLQERLGGPSVMPYQPEGLWEELAYDADSLTAQRYVQSHGPDLYRRSLYTFWKRAVPPPGLAAFDAPNREQCTVSRARSNTPLQALVLMNDPTYVEAARHLAERILNESGPSFRKRLEHCFLLLLGRVPEDREVELLERSWQQVHKRFEAAPDAAETLFEVGETLYDDRFDIAELAAWTVICQILMNTDESITRP